MAATTAPSSSPALAKDSQPNRTKSRSGQKPDLMVLTPQQSHTLSTSTSFSSTTSESTPATASTSATTTATATPTAASQFSSPGPSTPHHPLRGARSGTRIAPSPDHSTLVPMGASLPSVSLAPAGGPGAAAAAGGAQFHQGTTSYGSHHPLPPRPYTPATPSTPTGMQLTIPPLTPPSAAVLTSPRLEAHHHHHHHHASNSSGSKSPGLFPFGGTAAGTQRVGSISGPSGGTGGGATTRRMPSSESSLYDPYRARQPGVSANRVKNEYQAQSPIRENYAVFASQHPTTYASTSLGSSSEEDLHNQQHGHHKESLTEEQVFGMMIMHPPPSIGQREDYYRHSPTLTASQTLAANYGNASTSGSSRPESPFQSSPYLPYQSYQPYSHQLPMPSPLTMESGYGLPSPMTLASPGLSPFQYSGHEELRSEHKADPYRSAFSTARDTGSSVGVQGYGSPYLGSGGGGGLGAGPQGSPTMMNEDFSSSFESRFSSVSRGGGSSANNSRYPLHVLAGQDSNQALSTAYYEHQHVHLQQQLQKQQQKAAASAAAASATAATSAGNSSASDGKGGEAGASSSLGKGASGHTRQSTQHPSQPSKTDSSGTKKGKTETDEDEENEVILQKLGVISVDSSGSRSGGTRSGLTQGSGRSRRKGQWTDESEEESQERGRPRQRRSMSARRRGGGRGRSEDHIQCCCCSRKVCIWLSMGLLACLAVSLYFLIPRAPQFSFESVASQNAPVVTKSRIREQFSIQLVVDSTSNYLSLRIDRMDVSITLKSADDGAMIANNEDLDSAFIISPKMSELVSLPMRLDYHAASPANGTATLNSTAGASLGNSTDVVYQQLVKACTPINLDNATESSQLSSFSRSSSSTTLMVKAAAPGLNVVIHGQMHVWGLSWVWKPSFDISVTNLPCPINAPRNPVSELPPGPAPPLASPSRGVV